jgi:NADPH-dependent F420 reductase
MKIAVLGAGSVGGVLGRQFAEAGHEVAFGVRSPGDEKYRAIIDGLEGARVATVADAARGAEVVVLAVPWDAARTAIADAGDLSGKVVVDCTNPLKYEDGRLSLTMGFDTSGAEAVAGWAKEGRVVKCFNTTGDVNMAEPVVAGARSMMFVAGDDAAARETVLRLAQEIGFDAVDAGGLEQARLLEPLAMLWIHLAFTTPLGRDFAFGILRRAERGA